jgi:multimeric flavodoxin WrbA
MREERSRFMKVMAICGSPRPKGNTYHLLQEAIKVLQQQGIDTEYVSLHDLDIRPCLACEKCAQEKNRCSQEDDFNDLYDKLARADGLIVGSPVYFGSATPNMMALLDRAGYVARMGDNVFARKVGSPIVVARRAGVNFTYAQLLYFFMIMGMVVPGSTYWPIAFGRGPGEVTKDEEGMKTVAALAENIAWLLKKLR